MLGIAGSLLGSVASGVLGMFGQDSANDASEEAMKKRYQWSTRDMMKAGLNPAAMYSGGGMSPGGIPNYQNTMQAPAAALKDAASSATQIMIANKTIDQLTSQIAKQNADTENVRAALPGIAADAGLKDMEYGDIRKIPPAIRVPIVQSGYGIDKFKGAGQAAAIGGAVAASAKSSVRGAADVLRPLSGLSGPDVASARAVARELKRKYDAFPSYSEAEREAARQRNKRRWGWLTGEKPTGSVQYQQ